MAWWKGKKHMSWFMIWLFGAILFPLGLGIANRYVKVVHASDFKKEDDVMGFAVGLILASCFWPICTAIIIIIGAGMAFRKFFIPD
jgi:1,4-dihydroxy-2-naphthoate octaprenyltransferase